MGWTADLNEGTEETADLPSENVPDRAPTVSIDSSDGIDSAALQEVDAAYLLCSEGSSAKGESSAGLPTIRKLPLAPMPRQCAFGGFFSFVACALVAILVTARPPTESSHPGTEIMLAGSLLESEAKQRRILPSISAVPSGMENGPQTQATQCAESKRMSATTNANIGEVAFEPRSFATSEKAVAAVFIVRPTKVERGGAVVQWAARSGSADAGIDFSDASGAIRFADWQQQRAIYVPLRNDLLKEEDETFKVCLLAPRQARIGGMACAQATIRDDDGI